MSQSAAPLLLHLRRLAAPPARETAPDAALLERFARQDDQDAFAALVARHGPMVFGVCRRVLSDLQDAEDAVQATFLLLARKAAGVRQPAALAAYLHGIALRVARKARARRRLTPPLVTDRADPQPDPLDALSSRELLAILDEEVARLPEAFRLPIVLCYLQGRTAVQAAEFLGWTPGSVRGRLERARARLQQRLTRRGLAVPAGLLGVALGTSAATAALPVHLRAEVVHLGAQVVGAAVNAASPRVAALSRAAGRAMIGNHIKAAAIGLVLLGTLTAGALVMHPEPAPQPPAKPAPAALPSPQPRARLDLHGDPLPAGALARLGTIRFRHSYFTGGVVFSPDGKKLATLGGNSSARPLVIWDAQTGRQLLELAVPGSVLAAAFGPDGKTVVALARSQGALRWDIATGKQISRIADTGGAALAALTPDGKLLVTSDGDRNLRLFDLVASRSIRDMTVVEAEPGIRALAISRDGKRIASGSLDGTVRLWDPETGGTQREWTIPHGANQALAFSPDGKGLASGAEDGTVQLWDVRTAKQRWSQNFGKEATLHAITFSPDAKTLAASAGRSVRLLDAATGKELRRWDDLSFPVRGLDFSPDGKTLAAAGVWRSAVQLYDVATGKARQTGDGHTASVTALHFATDGKTLTSLGRDDAGIRWDLATLRGQRLPDVPVRGTWVRNLSPDGKVLATADIPEGKVCLWDLASGKEGAVLGKLVSGVENLAFAPDGRLMALAMGDSTIRLWDVAGHKELRRLEGLEQLAGGRSLAFSPDGKILVAAPWQPTRKPPIRMWDVASGKLLRQLDAPRWGCTVAFSPDGKYLAAGGLDDHEGKHLVRPTDGRDAWVWETATWERRYLRGHVKGIAALAFSPDGRLLASGGCEGDDRICVWDLDSGKQLKTLRGQHSGIAALAFSPDGRTLASGAGDSTILLWDLGR
jgi:RNA polymerase sigma factor (sigma-70 family)